MDDLEAVRAIVDILGKVESKEVQERVIRWSLEKLDLKFAGDTRGLEESVGTANNQSRIGPQGKVATDIKTFILSKAPSSDNQFAAAVAYYYAFEAPADQQKSMIGPSDLTEACRMVGRARLGDPAKTLANATGIGYLDKVDRGAFRLNTVGENLVAISMPSGSAEKPSVPRKRTSPAKKGVSQKKKAKKR